MTQADSQAQVHKERVAVIAIHGVGRHLSGASADAVATLLTSIGRDLPGAEKSAAVPPPYSAYTTESIDIPLRPVQTPPEEQPDKKPIRSIFDERRGFLANRRLDPNWKSKEERHLRPGEPDRGNFGYQFMQAQLVDYEAEPDRSFSTVRLETTRSRDSNETEVHIYDAHYSDLTKPDSSFVGLFFAFYQLLFHLASLSLQAVYWAEAENAAPGKRIQPWRILSPVHATAVRLLIMWIPLLNAILLLISFSAAVDRLPSGKAAQIAISAGTAAVLGIVITLLIAGRAKSPPRPVQWALVPLVGTLAVVGLLAGAACLYTRFLGWPDFFWKAFLVLSWLIVAGAVLATVAKIYSSMRPGAFELGIFLYVVNALIFLFILLPRAGMSVSSAAFWEIQLIFGELAIAWVICLLCAMISWPLGSFCFRTSKETPAGSNGRARAISALRTGRLAFAVPAMLFLIVTCALWSVLVFLEDEQFHFFMGARRDGGPSEWALVSRIVPSFSGMNSWLAKIHAEPAVSFSVYLKGLLLLSVTPGLPLTLLMLAVSFFLLAWAVLPSVGYEIKPKWALGASASRAERLGSWLSRGIDGTAIFTRLLWFGIVVVPLTFGFAEWLSRQGWTPAGVTGQLDRFSSFTWMIVGVYGLIATSASTAVFGIGLKTLGTVLDTVLDVDNYLRTSPKEATPRARIAERYTSLLRYIAQHGVKTGQPYSKVIIVAHSLGSMVTTDLLRFLQRASANSRDGDLDRFAFGVPDRPALPICVFSMGCPLRQLLNRFFPQLYWWVSDKPDNSDGNPLGRAIQKFPDIITAENPRCDEMRAAFWVNAYRSGDYVGRCLWIGEWLERGTKPPAFPQIAGDASGSTKRFEMCIGAGAHTHYWDRTAPEIAEALDHLIVTDLLPLPLP
jgi:hypothetical protein